MGIELHQQADFWNNWVAESKAWESNPQNQRRGRFVVNAVVNSTRPGGKVLDVGCGTGWVALELSRLGYHVVGVDLAHETMEKMGSIYPQVRWIGGDFCGMTFDPCSFDAIVTLETIAHVVDQALFAERIAELLTLGGLLALTSQNPYVWHRTRSLQPRGEGQLRDWPSRSRLKMLFGRFFEGVTIGTVAPNGDKGLPRLFNNRIARDVGSALVGEERWATMQERMGLGCSFALRARKPSMRV